MDTGDGRKWRGYQAQYRLYLYGIGEEHDPGNATPKRRAGLSAKAVAEVTRHGGHLHLEPVVRVRVRYFTFKHCSWKPRMGRRGLCEESREAQGEAGARCPPVKIHTAEAVAWISRFARITLVSKFHCVLDQTLDE